jgi:hypothetical protein
LESWAGKASDDAIGVTSATIRFFGSNFGEGP